MLVQLIVISMKWVTQLLCDAVSGSNVYAMVTEQAKAEGVPAKTAQAEDWLPIRT